MPSSSTSARLRGLLNLRGSRRTKEIAIEIIVIAFGIGLALFGEFLITEWNWHNRVERARVELKDEARGHALNAMEQLIVTPCLLAQFDAIEAHLLDPGKNAVPLSSIETPAGRSVIRIPTRPWPSAAWEATINDGVAARLKNEVRGLTAGYYRQIESLRVNRFGRQELRGRLGLLGLSAARTQETNLRLLETLQELRTDIEFDQVLSRQILQTMALLDRLPEDKLYREYVDWEGEANETIDHCRKNGLPTFEPEGGWLDLIETNASEVEQARRARRLIK